MHSKELNELGYSTLLLFNVFGQLATLQDAKEKLHFIDAPHATHSKSHKNRIAKPETIF